MADQDQLSKEDMDALQAAHQHLVSSGDARASKLGAYIQQAMTSYAPPPVAPPMATGLKSGEVPTQSEDAARVRYRNEYGQEPPETYPKHLPGTGLDEIQGAAVGAGLATKPLLTLRSLVGSEAGSHAIEAVGGGPIAQFAGGVAGGGLGAGLPSIYRGIRSIPASEMVQFMLHPRTTMTRALINSLTPEEEAGLTAQERALRVPLPVRYPTAGINPVEQSQMARLRTPPPINYPEGPALDTRFDSPPPINWPQPTVLSPQERALRVPPPVTYSEGVTPDTRFNTPPPVKWPQPPVLDNRFNTPPPIKYAGQPEVPIRLTPQERSLRTPPPIKWPGRGQSEAGTATGTTTPTPDIQPVEGESVMVKGNPLAPVNKFEMNRMAHARAQELELPDSPAGKNGHSALSQAATEHYGVDSWSKLNVKQMKQIYEYLDEHGVMPKKGQIPKL